MILATRRLCLFLSSVSHHHNTHQTRPPPPASSPLCIGSRSSCRRRRRYRCSAPPVVMPDPQPPVTQLDAAEEGVAVGTGGWSSANVDLPGVQTVPVVPAAVDAAAAGECPPCASCPACPACPSAPAAVRGADAAAGGVTCADIDMGQCRKESLEQTTPHIIECSEAGEGGSQEVRGGGRE